MSEVAFAGVTKRFGEVTAVDQLSLSIRDGEFMVLLGPSGCGKTTALRMIAGLESTTSGHIRIGDRDVTNVLPKHRDVAMVFQSYALVRIKFQVKIATVLVFILLMIALIAAVTLFRVPWTIGLAVGFALFVIALFTLSPRTHLALGNSDIEFWIISNRIMPPIVAVLPIYVMFQQLRLLDTQVALIATYAAVNLPIVVWLTRDFFATIPLDLEESAEIDGASKFRVFFTIALPLVRSGLVATFLLVLILAWNEYLLALFLSNAKAQTMPVLVSAQNTTRGPQWWNMSVLIVIMIAPVLVIATVLQKHIARGLLVGAVKG
jgi:multiple sugar transport system permease protein